MLRIGANGFRSKLQSNTFVLRDRKGLNDLPDSLRGAGAGALIGGFALGPLGAFLGAQIGSSFGARNDRSKQIAKELGVDIEVVEAGNKLMKELSSLQEAEENLRNSLESQGVFLERLKKDEATAYEAAKAELVLGREEGARSQLLQREKIRECIKKATEEINEMNKRYESLTSLKMKLEAQGKVLGSIVERSRIAKADSIYTTNEQLLQSASEPQEFKRPDDPIEERFRRLERGET
jgi:hypothetical protein